MVNLTDITKGTGSASHQISLAKYFIEHGVDLRIITPAQSKLEYTPEYIHNICYIPISVTGFGLPGSLDSILQIPVLIWLRLIGRFNVLYIRATALSVLINVIARLLLMKVIVEHNGWMASERIERGRLAFLSGLERHLQILAARTAHMNRTVTMGLQRLLIDAGIKEAKTVVIGNGTDLSQFYPMDRDAVLNELKWDSSITRIGYIGGIVPWQGLEDAIKAFSRLNKSKNLRLVIAGDGPDMTKIRDLAVELKVSEQIDFLGYIQREKANLIINSFDIAIAPFTSRRNQEIGLSAIKIRDYAAAGRFVVCSDIPELLETKSNIWIRFHPPDDAETLATVLEQVLQEDFNIPENKKAARQYAEKYFDWNKVASRVLDCIDGL